MSDRISAPLHGPAAPTTRDWWRLAAGLAAVVSVVASGLLLGYVLLSPRWASAITVIGMTAVVLVMLVKPGAGLLLWIALAPYAEYIYLKVNLGSGIPDLDISRLAILLLTFRLISQVSIERSDPVSEPRRRLARVTLPDILMVAFILGISLSMRPSAVRNATGIRNILEFIGIPLLMYYVAPLLTYYLARNWLRSSRALVATVAVVAASSTLLSIISIREQLTGFTLFSPIPFSLVYEGHIRKVLSLFGAPAIMTTAVTVPLPFILYGMQEVKTAGKRLLLGIALVVTLAGVFFVYVRAGWLGALLGIIAMAAFSPRIRSVLLRLLPVLAMAIVLIVTVAVSPNAIQSRLASEAPITYRLEAWKIALDLFARSPLIGIGYDAFNAVAVAQFGFDPHNSVGYLPSTHNSYLYVLVSGGLVAFLPYLGIFLSLLWRGLRFWQRPGPQRADTRELVATLWATLLAYMLINGTVDALNAQYTNVLLFLMIGALIGRLEEITEERTARNGEVPA